MSEACIQTQIDALEQRDTELAARIGDTLDEDVILGVLGDPGERNNTQIAVSAMLQRLDVQYLLATGDNNYPDGEQDTLENNWLTFRNWFEDAAIFPALGNHDLDNTSGEPGQPQTDKFYYLPGCKRYYKIYIGEADTDIYVLNTGYKTDNTLVEPDGNTVGSVQQEWFTAAVEESTARRKICMWHEPFTTSALDGAGKIMRSEMIWPGLEQMDLIINGHVHIDEVLHWRGIPILNTNCVRTPRTHSNVSESNPYTITGQSSVTTLDWRDTKFFEGGKISDNAGLASLDGMTIRIILRATGGIRVEYWRAQFAVQDEFYYAFEI